VGQQASRGFFCYQGVRCFSTLGAHDPHFLPVITKLFAAIQTSYISTRALR
jgi:hypothetical protein